ncbi:MAG: RNA polymerase sigma factor [Acidimicrobiia bacterium]
MSPDRNAGHIRADQEDEVQELDGPHDARFAGIYDRHRSAVWLYCRRRVGADKADDVMGEVFLTVWRRIDQAPPGSEALPWLYRICRLTVANHWRGAARRWRLEAKISAIRVTPPSPIADQVVVREEARAVVRFLDDMRPPDAEILRLAAWEGLNTTEIATVLDISPDAAKQRLSRARRRLSDSYDAYEKKRFINNPSAQEGGVW